MIIFISFANGLAVLDCIVALYSLQLAGGLQKCIQRDETVYSRKCKAPIEIFLTDFQGDLCSDVIFQKGISVFLVAWQHE